MPKLFGRCVAEHMKDSAAAAVKNGDGHLSMKRAGLQDREVLIDFAYGILRHCGVQDRRAATIRAVRTIAEHFTVLVTAALEPGEGGR